MNNTVYTFLIVCMCMALHGSDKKQTDKKPLTIMEQSDALLRNVHDAQECLEPGTNIDVFIREATPLYHATALLNLHLVNLLIGHRARVDYDFITKNNWRPCLHMLAVKNPDDAQDRQLILDITQALINANADIDRKDAQGMTASGLALQCQQEKGYKNQQFIDLLREHRRQKVLEEIKKPVKDYSKHRKMKRSHSI